MKTSDSHKYEFEFLKNTSPVMEYKPDMQFNKWKAQASAKLEELLGLPLEKCDPMLKIESETQKESFIQYRLSIQTEPGYFVPCYLLMPDKRGTYPLTINLSGHGGGMHIAIGETKCEADENALKSWHHRAMGLRAISEGRCALVIEARNFGEASLEGYGTSCTEAAKIAILMGRTVIGERVWDAMRIIDAVAEKFPQIDMTDVVCTGNSGGGTATYYLACMDERIKTAMPSCSICSYETSIAAMSHCMCNHIPGIRKYFEMGDLAGLIAPRKLIIAAGKEDEIFPIDGTIETFRKIKVIYSAAGVPGNCALVTGDKGHLNYADLLWDEFYRMSDSRINKNSKRLVHTEQLIKEKIKDKSLESYILLVGYGNEEWMLSSTDVNPDSYFDAASVGKVFPTGTLALMAIDKGLLSLDDTLAKFFPDVPDDKKNITVKQLMTHTSGMLRREFPDNVADRGRESIAEFILNVPLAYEPGTKYAYCCTAIMLLGFIVEKVFGMGLDEAMQKYISEPLGLTRSRYNIPPDEPNAINCHHDPSVTDIRRDDNNVKKMKDIPAGPGGGYITANDLKKFVRALMIRDERLYKKEIFDLAEQNYTENLPVLDIKRGIENHGLVFTYINENCMQARDLFPDGSIGHDGYTGQCFYLNRKKNLYMILLTNATRCYVKKHGTDNYDDVCAMRAEFCRALNEDLKVK